MYNYIDINIIEILSQNPCRVDYLVLHKLPDLTIIKHFQICSGIKGLNSWYQDSVPLQHCLSDLVNYQHKLLVLIIYANY